MSSADAPGDLPAVDTLTVRDAGGEPGKGKGAVSEPEASAADAAKPSLKPLTDEQRAKITTQVEFYFSDVNLPTDAFLLKKVRADPEGWVPIQTVCGFNRMKQLLKKHPPAATVAAIVAEQSRVLVVDETLLKIRRAEPLPDFDLEDIQARTVVAENLGAEPTIEGVARAFTLDVADDAAETSAPDADETEARDAKTKTRSVPPTMVRVRHPGMRTQAEVCAATTGLDLVRVAAGGTHALVEYATRELAELAARTLNDDEDWRRGLRVRLLVKSVKAAAKQKKQREERARRDEEAREWEGEEGDEGDETNASEERERDGDGDGESAEPGAVAGGTPETAPRKKGKHRKGKRDYSQWASAAAFKENKTFLEGEDGGASGAGDAAGSPAAPAASGARDDENVAPSVSTGAARLPAMPDGTRGFAGAAATGKPRRAFPPGVPKEPQPRAAKAEEAER